MRVALGLKAHSGWAALVVVGQEDRVFSIIDRRRMELVEEEWAKQPYHAAENLNPDAARDVVKRGIEAARRIAIREMHEAVRREQGRGNEVAACAVLVGEPMPDWSVDEILAVHFRMHKAEGVLFRDALVRAARSCELRLAAIPEKSLAEQEKVLGIPMKVLVTQICRPSLGERPEGRCPRCARRVGGRQALGGPTKRATVNSHFGFILSSRR